MFGKKKRTLKEIQQGPVPPLGDMDYATLQKFLLRAKQYAEDTGFNYYAYLNWVIEVLLHSLESDSTSRIFLPKTDTAPFEAEDLFPFSAVPTYSVEKVSLEKAYIIAPMWNDSAVCQAMFDVSCGNEGKEVHRPKGYYIADIGLAVICSSDVHSLYFSQLWKRGEMFLKVASLADMADIIHTDGENWYIADVDDEEDWYPVQEPRMAALYSMALERVGLNK